MSAAGPPATNPSLRRAAGWIALVLFLLYCGDLAWKLAHWSQYAAGLKVWQLALAITIRFVFMSFLLSMYVRARRMG
ncbi:MAG TPA: hypothetical protein VJ453_08465 [Terriglobales bacterium]|jgi:hypothetical protein|nr:hypothetical protein [Terriglobales bacterium]